MFSEEEIQKIAEAAGGGVTPEDVKDILDGALMSDDTTKALVDDIIYNYLELNPPTAAIYQHEIAMSSADTYISLTLITNSKTAFTYATLRQFLIDKNSTSRIRAVSCSGAYQSGSSIFTVIGIWAESGIIKMQRITASSYEEGTAPSSASDHVIAI